MSPVSIFVLVWLAVDTLIYIACIDKQRPVVSRSAAVGNAFINILLAWWVITVK